MKLIDVKLKRLNLKELIDRALQSFHFDEIRIIGVDPSNQQLFELQYSDKENIESLFTNYCKRIINIIEIEQKALLINDEFIYQNEIYNKYNDRNSIEIYVPVFKIVDNYKTIAGIVFIACETNLDIDISNNLEFDEFFCELHSLLVTRYDLARKKESSYQVAYMLCEIIDMKEPYLISRLFNIAYWGVKIAREMGLPQEDIDKLQIATLMHDLGRIYISENILNKKGKLTNQEYELIKKRVNYSFEIAKKLEALYEINDLPEIILSYQERIDGTGYPLGKKGDEIPHLSKILGTAKAIASMLTNTSYRTAKTIDEVINELKNGSNKQFDETVVDAAIIVLASERKFSEDCLMGMGSFATFNLKINNNDKNESLNIWGNIRKMDKKYVLTPTVRLHNYDSLIIQSCSLYISFNDQIIHYIPSIKEINEERIEFSHLELDKDNNAFAINWLLPALIVTPLRNVYEIYVTTIGGDHIDFYIFSKDIKEDIANGVIKLTFEDGNEATLPGIIISDDRIDDRILFRLKYIGINYEDMKIVFAQIFKKQIELRNILNKL